mgnify:CR=1 FL=1
MPGCSGHLRFLAALQRKGWCRNDEVCAKVGDSICGSMTGCRNQAIPDDQLDTALDSNSPLFIWTARPAADNITETLHIEYSAKSVHPKPVT